MLLALLLPDPCDPACPSSFKDVVREALVDVQGSVGPGDQDVRESLLKFIGNAANWDLSSNQTYLSVARRLVNAAYPDGPPLVLDPFAGGGSIPLEGLRLGCDVFATDLNPISCMILRVLLEDIPRYGGPFADEVRDAGLEVKELAKAELARFYPVDSDGGVPFAYIWARTVRCETPSCGAEIPIFKSAWLSKRSSKRARFFREAPDGDCTAILIETAPRGGPIDLRIAKGFGSADPLPNFREPVTTKAKGNNSNVWCPCCNQVLAGPRVMAQLKEQRGGAAAEFDDTGRRIGGATLLAVATKSRAGRTFRPPRGEDYAAVSDANDADARDTLGAEAAVINPVRPSPNARGLTAPTRYGAATFADLFTPRQRVAIRTLIRCMNAPEGQHAPSNAIARALTLALGRCIDQSSAHVRWLAGIQAIASSFPRQAVQMTWDFVESVPIGDESANFGAAVEWVSKVIEQQGLAKLQAAQTLQADAESLPLGDESCDVLFTDPPYYDAVPYSDLANFFFVWLGSEWAHFTGDGWHSNAAGLSPTDQECIWHRGHIVDGSPKERAFFESKMLRVFTKSRKLVRNDGILCIVFAHKTTEGWEALISGLIAAGLVVHSSWPIATERSARTNAQGTASLSTSVHLVCRPRPEGAKVGDWGEVLAELPRRVGDWMERLQLEGVRGADLVFACIGPALEIFSRYATVETAEGRPVPLSEYLEKVWEVVGRSALEHVLSASEVGARNGSASAVEEDARLTALFLWTIQSTVDEPDFEDETEDSTDDEGEGEFSAPASSKGFTLIYDVVRRFAQPLGINLAKWEGRIISTKKGVVRLMPVSERARQLFGPDGAEEVAARLEERTKDANPLQGLLFPEMEVTTRTSRGRRHVTVNGLVSDESLATANGATTLDRVHAAMLLQAGGRTNALRALLNSEQERNPVFLRLANALTALYPKGSEEKRLLDAMLIAVPR